MNEELKKSLTDLIDETLMELEELKKSRFSAAEIEIKGPGEGIDGKPSNGKLDAAKAEDKKEEDKKEDEEEEKEEASKSEDKKEDKKEEDKKEDDKDGEKKEADEKKALGAFAGMKKSEEEMSSLMKSYVDERVKPLEDKLTSIFDLVSKMASQPVIARGATARTQILTKSVDEGTGESLSKAEVASKLFELKKSGSSVDSLDVTKAEMGQDLERIVKKYKLS